MMGDPVRLVWVALVGIVLLSTLFWGRTGLIASLASIGAVLIVLLTMALAEKGS